MRNKKSIARMLTFALCTVLILVLKPPLPASAEEERVSGRWNYVVRGVEAYLRGYNPPFPETIVIPSQVDGYAVREAEILPLAVLDDDRAFESREVIHQVEIPAGVREVDLGLLPNLTRINVEEGNERYASYEGVLYSADGTTLIQCPRRWDDGVLYLLSSVTAIGEFAFFGCELEGLVLPEGLREIGKEAFEFCALTDQEGLYLPEELVSIGDGAFQEAGISEIHISTTLQTVGFFAFGGQKLLVHQGTYMERYAQANGYDYALCTSCESAFNRLSPSSGDSQNVDDEDDLTGARANLAGVPTPLKRGDSGENVRLLQAALIESNFLYDEDDGVYGSGTVAAVKALQKEAGRKQTGVFEAEDRKELLLGLYPTFVPQSVPLLFYNGHQEGNRFNAFVRNIGDTPIDRIVIYMVPLDRNKKNITNDGETCVYWAMTKDIWGTFLPGQSRGLTIDLTEFKPDLAEGKSHSDIAYLEVSVSAINDLTYGDTVEIDPPARRYFPVKLTV